MTGSELRWTLPQHLVPSLVVLMQRAPLPSGAVRRPRRVDINHIAEVVPSVVGGGLPGARAISVAGARATHAHALDLPGSVVAEACRLSGAARRRVLCHRCHSLRGNRGPERLLAQNLKSKMKMLPVPRPAIQPGSTPPCARPTYESETSALQNRRPVAPSCLHSTHRSFAIESLVQPIGCEAPRPQLVHRSQFGQALEVP